MSRSFTKNTSNHVSLGTAALNPLLAGAPAISSFVWAYARSLTNTGAVTDNVAIIAYMNGTGAGHALRVSGSLSFVGVLSRSQSADALSSPSSTTNSFQLNRWVAIGGVSNFADKSVTAYTDGQRVGFTGGVSYGANAYTPGTPSVPDRIGALNTSATANQWDGFLAHAAIWRTALTDDEYGDLAEGRDPQTIRPESLVFYAPMQDTQGVHDIVNGVQGTITGSVPISEDPCSLWTPDDLIAPPKNLAKLVALLEAA